MDIRIIREPISRSALREFIHPDFMNMVKAVVDVQKGIMALGGELHADEELVLTEREHSTRADTWGINLYPDQIGEDFIEFDSMINLKPAFGNRSRRVEDLATQEQIKKIVATLILP